MHIDISNPTDLLTNEEMLSPPLVQTIKIANILKFMGYQTFTLLGGNVQSVSRLSPYPRIF